jgi:hypothetical protein
VNYLHQINYKKSMTFQNPAEAIRLQFYPGLERLMYFVGIQVNRNGRISERTTSFKLSKRQW